MSGPPSLAILLGSYNGAAYLEQQLGSIAAQDYPSWRLYVSDDGSQDATLSMLEQTSSLWGRERLAVRTGPGEGYVANFLSLLCAPNIEATYYALSDQDDYWHPSKLSRAVAWLESVDEHLPALYCARSQSISASGEPLGCSPLFARPPSFANALIQNIGGGNTMVLNRAARKLLQSAGMVNVASHDWWIYLLITGAGGVVRYDSQPTINYRQHQANLIGANLSWRDRAGRYLGALGGRNRGWNTLNIQALRQNEDLLTRENQNTLQQFSTLRDSGLMERLVLLQKSGVYAQTVSGSLGLFVATILKKL